MRISDWSSDVCSPDLPASSSVPALTSTARGSAYTSSRCRTDTDHCAQPSAPHQSQHPSAWQEAAHPDPDPRPATPPHNPNGASEHFPQLGPQVPDRKSVAVGKSVSVSLDTECSRTFNTKKK